MPVTFKFVLPQEGVTRKVTFPSKPKWHEIATKVESLFSGYRLAANEIALSYIDSDNDSITISTGEELRDFYEQEAKTLASGTPFKFFVKRLPRPASSAGGRNRLSDIIPQVDDDPLGPNSPDSGMLGGHGWDEVEHDSLPDTPMGIPVFTAPGGIGIQPLMHSMFNYIPSEPNRGRGSPAISEARIEEVPSRTGSAGVVEDPPARASRAYSPSPIPTRVPPSKAKKGKEKLAEKLAEKLPDKVPERRERERGKPKDRDAPIVIDLPRDGNRPFSLNTPDSPRPARPIPQVPFGRRETGPTEVDTPTSDEEIDIPSPPSPRPAHRRPSTHSAQPSVYNDISEVMSKLSLVMRRASDGTYVRNQDGVVDPALAEAAMESARAAIEDTAKAVGSSLNSVLSQLSAHIPQQQQQQQQQQRQPRSKKSEMPFFGSTPSQPKHRDPPQTQYRDPPQPQYREPPQPQYREPPQPQYREPPQPQYQHQPQPQYQQQSQARPNSFYAYDTSGRDATRPQFAPPPPMAPPPVQMHSRPDERVPPPFVPYGAFQPPVVVPAPGPPPVGPFFGGPPPQVQRSTSTRPQYDQPVYGQFTPQGPLPQTRPTSDPQGAEHQHTPGADDSPPFRATANLPSAAERERLEAAKQLYKMEKATFRAQRQAERREREERRALRQKGNPQYEHLHHSLEAVFAAHQVQEMESRPDSEEEEEVVEPPRPIRPADVPSFFQPPMSGQPEPPGSSEDEGPIHVFPARSPGPSKHRGPYHERSERLLEKLDAMGFSVSKYASLPQVVKEESRKNLTMPDEEIIQRIIDSVLETEEPPTPAPQGPSKGANNKTTGPGARRKGRK
ncbi:hypothetical protein FS837_010432 [Tulasnella sp. UAMH 9824]|nr:hypothetical protein FS837_010432 [Tulasnella sp. UAMH 9824]